MASLAGEATIASSSAHSGLKGSTPQPTIGKNVSFDIGEPKEKSTAKGAMQSGMIGNFADMSDQLHDIVDRKIHNIQNTFLCTQQEASPHGAGFDVESTETETGSRYAVGGGGELVVDAVLDAYVNRMKQEVLGELREDIRSLTATAQALQDELQALRERQEQSMCYAGLQRLFGLSLTRSAGAKLRRPTEETFRSRRDTTDTNMPPVPDELTADASVSHVFSIFGETSTMIRRVSLPLTTQRSMRALSEAGIQPAALLAEKLYLTGPFSNWKLDQADGQLQNVARSCKAGSADPPHDGVVRLRACVQLSSMSFSFQVVNPVKKWKWHLYPRDAVLKVWGLHVSKEGRLWPDQPAAVVVGLGDLNAGHQKNFHVIEPVGTIVTVWVDVPVSPACGNDSVSVRYDTVDEARVWYTLEDTGVQCVGGDGIDLNKWKRFQAMFE